MISAISVTSAGMLEALGKGTQSFIISLLRYIVIMIPIAILLSSCFGPIGVWNAFWVSEFATAFIGYKRYIVKINYIFSSN